MTASFDLGPARCGPLGRPPTHPREVCPEPPGAPELIHWSIPDPAREPGRNEQTLPTFERTAAELETRIGLLIEAIKATRQEVTERA